MDIRYIREYLISRYAPSEKWAAKVRKMTDAQAYAVYMRMIQAKKAVRSKK